MKISDSTVSGEMARLARMRQQAHPQTKGAGQSEGSTPSREVRQDSVTVSVHSKDELPKVERLRMEVMEGTYRPDPTLVAQRLLAEEPELEMALASE